MQAPKPIQSSKNPQYKNLVRLFQKARERKKTGLFVVEGAREMQRAVVSGYELQQLWLRADTEPPSDMSCDLSYQLQASLFDKITQRGGSVALLGVFRSKITALTDLDLSQSARILVAEAPEKPGNTGALLRTAAAAGLDAVLIANPKSDLYNPQVIRNSLGGIFTLPVVQEESATIIRFLKENKFFTVAAAITKKSVPYNEIKYPQPLAIVVGTEAQGLEEIWLKSADVCVTIQMQAPIDSLNVSVAAGILVFHSLNSSSF